jgi:hypothetical protein
METIKSDGLGLLLRAYELARDSEADIWQFAVAAEDLRATGLHAIDLTWLLHRGFASHAVETTLPGQEARTFQGLTTRIVAESTHFVLSEAGYQHLTAGLAGEVAQLPLNIHELQAGSPTRMNCPTCGFAEPSPTVQLASNSSIGNSEHEPTAILETADAKPVWDADQRELRFRGRIVKRYRVPARNQELVLAVFQEEGWPASIDDPLPPENDQEPKHRLQATIKSLNRNRIAPILRFRGNGNGDRICWSAVS